MCSNAPVNRCGLGPLGVGVRRLGAEVGMRWDIFLVLIKAFTGEEFIQAMNNESLIITALCS